MIGVQIGVYRVVRQIGEGGMGAVWLAEHVMLGRPVAIKVLHREASLRPELVQRFFNEAKAATAISDPGIIQIFDFGHHSDGNAYIVMELLEGEPLDHRLSRLGKLPLPSALRILRQVASSLAAAHRRGIIHRDIKPENIFLVRDPEVVGGERTKLLDFGIAKLTTDQRVKTHTSAVMGTPVFMSPEQCRGAGQVDHRSDLYSLGCVLFALLTGRPPFDADGAGEIIAMHLREPPPRPSTFLPGLPAAVDELVLRCLAKDREQRYQSGAELAAAIEAIAEALAAHEPPRRQSTEGEVATVPRPPIAMTPPPRGGSESDTTVPRPPIAMTPIDTEPMPLQHPQAVPIMAMPSVGPNALAHLAQAVTMTPLPEAQASGARPQPSASQAIAAPMTAVGEEATAPFVPPARADLRPPPVGTPMPTPMAMPSAMPSAMPGAMPGAMPSAMPGARAMPPTGPAVAAVSAVPMTIETMAAPGGRPSQAGMTTLSQSAGSGPVARKSGAQVGLIVGVVALGAVVGVALVTLSSSSTPESSSAASAGQADSGQGDAVASGGEAVAVAPVAPDQAGGEGALGGDATAAVVAPVTPVTPVAPVGAAAPVVEPAPPDAAPTMAPAPPEPAPAVVEPAPPVAAPAPAPPSEPAEQARTVERLRAVASAFTTWAKDHAGKPCPAIGDFGLALDPGDGRDGWGTAFHITCKDQPSSHRVGIISAGPDRKLGSSDDLASWKVLASSLRGARWGASVESPPKASSSSPKKPSSGKPAKQPASTNTVNMPTKRI